MKYSSLKDDNDNETKNHINHYMTIWSDFLKILAIQLTSAISAIATCDKNNVTSQNKFFLNTNSELFNEAVFINFFAETEEERIKNITDIENSLTHSWSIFGQEFINVII